MVTTHPEVDRTPHTPTKAGTHATTTVTTSTGDQSISTDTLADNQETTLNLSTVLAVKKSWES